MGGGAARVRDLRELLHAPSLARPPRRAVRRDGAAVRSYPSALPHLARAPAHAAAARIRARRLVHLGGGKLRYADPDLDVSAPGARLDTRALRQTRLVVPAADR